MKSWEEIKKRYKRGHYAKVAALIGIDARNVEYVVKGRHDDHHNIQKIYSDMLDQEAELERKARKLKRKSGLHTVAL